VRPRVKALHRELREPFNYWLNENVYYIITPEGKATFFGLRPTKSATSSSSISGTPPLI